MERIGGQRYLAKESQSLRRSLGEEDFKKLEKSLFGGQTRNTGFDRPGALSRRGPAPGTLVESTSGVHGYLRSLPSHEKPLTSQYVGKPPVSLQVLRLLGLAPAAQAVKTIKDKRDNQPSY